ncbi:DNA-binding MarR family transcriptional regulator [Microbacterium terrae]|uniref:Helix-turn-helix domain protein n=1 Tax=Microbacterium terrae TaxID=69369 RepID=A0A0M2GZ89_9MICO|nr:transcriptional regulator [Microbacterium terrae]KJL39153.1 Helix-turn-helix domain protein [Microbacterium terrae]MBP1077692.1 DNA-binding MarR family transcriptional regulator [Microbacterium terrae]GLJ99859.1 MarR family transcriptional regulator [Microbacterium terrae]
MSELDPVIHAPARLRITTTLAEVLDDGDSITFPALQKLLDMTAGNLTTHLAKLADAGYVEVTKSFAGRKPVTHIALTHAGRGAFRAYRTQLLALLGGTP